MNRGWLAGHSTHAPLCRACGGLFTHPAATHCRFCGCPVGGVGGPAISGALPARPLAAGGSVPGGGMSFFWLRVTVIAIAIVMSAVGACATVFTDG